MVYVVAVAVRAEALRTKLLNNSSLQTFVPSAFLYLVRYFDDIPRGTSRMLRSCVILQRDVSVFQFAIAVTPQLRQSLDIGFSVSTRDYC